MTAARSATLISREVEHPLDIATVDGFGETHETPTHATNATPTTRLFIVLPIGLTRSVSGARSKWNPKLLRRARPLHAVVGQPCRERDKPMMSRSRVTHRHRA